MKKVEKEKDRHYDKEQELTQLGPHFGCEHETIRWPPSLRGRDERLEDRFYGHTVVLELSLETKERQMFEQAAAT